MLTNAGSAACETPTLEWSKALPWCNFVLFRPADLPGDFRVDDVSMRLERPPSVDPPKDDDPRPIWRGSNRSAHRLELTDGKRRVRIKQFLYDWAPAAFDHPSLWLSENRSFLVGDLLAWIGTDFAGRPAASLHMDRTMIELAALEGDVADTEWQHICSGLRPVSSAARRRILGTPLALLAYQSRHLEPSIAVPLSYWDYKRSSEEVALPASGVPPGLPGAHVRPLPARGFRLDSVFVYGTGSGIDEVDYVWCRDTDPGDYLHVLVSPVGSRLGLPFPPNVGKQPCRTAVLDIAGCEVFHAWLESLGPHHFVFRHDGLVVAVLFTPRVWTTRRWCLKVLDDLICNTNTNP